MDSAASKIKKFFAKKKSEVKFKVINIHILKSNKERKTSSNFFFHNFYQVAGPGRKLNSQESQPSSSSNSKEKDKDIYVPIPHELSEQSTRARDAALRRIEKVDKNDKEFNTSLAAIKAQAKKELEAEKLAREQGGSRPAPEPKVNEDFAVQGVYFRCPLISDECLPRKEWKVKIKEFLYEQLQVDPALTACLIIVNCNIKERADNCVETLKKYLENIIQNPGEEKYHKIRVGNRIFSEKVANVEGSAEFLRAAGFEDIEIDGEKFLLWNPASDLGNLIQLHESLGLSEVIALELDRNIQVLLPSQAKKTALPPEFFRISKEELLKEQLLRAEALENSQILKTKAMREKEELRIVNRYKFTLIRVRFPEGYYLQGTFNVYENLSAVYEFVKSCLTDELAQFSLIGPTGHKFGDEDMEQSLFNLR